MLLFLICKLENFSNAFELLGCPFMPNEVQYRITAQEFLVF
jgi:hypothetical protein